MGAMHTHEYAEVNQTQNSQSSRQVSMHGWWFACRKGIIFSRLYVEIITEKCNAGDEG
jgi:hypothetical protein